MRFRGELNDLLDDSSMANSYCTKEGKRLFFLCDSAKVPVVDIGRRKFDLPAARRRREKAKADKSTEGGKGSLGKRLGEQATLPRLSIIKRETPAKLLQRSFMKQTLKGDSFGPGDAHRRAMSNYYHVQDSLGRTLGIDVPNEEWRDLHASKASGDGGCWSGCGPSSLPIADLAREEPKESWRSFQRLNFAAS